MDQSRPPRRLEQLAELVRQIPEGRCACYGHLGRSLPNPVSGFLAGKWMAQLDDSMGPIPWWRVVKKDGTIAIFDRDPVLGMEQVSRLLAEGIPVEEGKVNMEQVIWFDFSPLD